MNTVEMIKNCLSVTMRSLIGLVMMAIFLVSCNRSSGQVHEKLSLEKIRELAIKGDGQSINILLDKEGVNCDAKILSEYFVLMDKFKLHDCQYMVEENGFNWMSKEDRSNSLYNLYHSSLSPLKDELTSEVQIIEFINELPGIPDWVRSGNYFSIMKIRSKNYLTKRFDPVMENNIVKLLHELRPYTPDYYKAHPDNYYLLGPGSALASYGWPYRDDQMSGKIDEIKRFCDYTALVVKYSKAFNSNVKLAISIELYKDGLNSFCIKLEEFQKTATEMRQALDEYRKNGEAFVNSATPNYGNAYKEADQETMTRLHMAQSNSKTNAMMKGIQFKEQIVILHEMIENLLKINVRSSREMLK